ncbi:MAG: hypothetical protein QOE61_5973, partial [Micromonosporaceae bacterium]|nr:hypothetical protein [Micromonosporaceae bacterium]
MDQKIVVAQSKAFTLATDIATSLSNRLAHPTSGASSSCDPQDLIDALRLFMGSNLFARENFAFDFQLEYPGLQVGRSSGCERSCRRPRALAEDGEASGNPTACPQDSVATLSAPSPTTSPPPTTSPS